MQSFITILGQVLNSLINSVENAIFRYLEKFKKPKFGEHIIKKTMKQGCLKKSL